MKINKYAPVIIPTLNRYDHFKRCLESLEKCTGAEYTDVYVGLDYPPSEKYVEGWKKIDNFLKEKEKKNCFLHLYVRRREHNCGIGKSGSNSNLLTAEMIDITDRYIFSEDDNEFSPNFLEYVNKGLELFKDNPRIIAISGYCYLFDINDTKKNAYPGYNYSAWGVGVWRDKVPVYREIGVNNFIENILCSWKLSWRMYRNNPAWFNGLMEMKFKHTIHGDTLKCAECLLYNRVTIYPKVSKVRNWGNDGTGEHCKIVKKEISEQKIDDALTFDFDEGVMEQNPVNFRSYLKPELYKWFGALFRYLYYRITHKDFFLLFM